MPAPRWCDGRAALFCEDFDGFTTVDSFLNSWSTFSQINGDFGFTDGPSAPNALRARTTATSDVNDVVAKTLSPPSTPSSIRLDFSLRVNQADSIGALAGDAIAAIILGTDIADGAIVLEVAPHNTGFGLYTAWYRAAGDAGPLGFGSQYVSPLPTLGTWAGRFSIEIRYSAAADAARLACVQMYAGGVAQGSCAPLSPGLETPPSLFTVALGVRSITVFGAPTGNVEVVYDNVLVTTK